MITSFFQKYYEDLKSKGDYVQAFAILRKNPEIVELDHENVELAQEGLKRVYNEFKDHIDKDELETGLTYVLRQSVGNNDLEFVLG